jgi:sn-glycerol 3-phosphate transport system ATP-binding protein
MNAGYAEQIGTPDQVYNTPATTFVASFIGSPPMNLLTGSVKNGQFSAGDGVSFTVANAPRDGDLVLGVRPEHLVVAAAGVGWPMTVEMVESLGAEYLIHARIAGQAIIVTTPTLAQPLKDGDVLSIVAQPDKLHWFDAKTTRRI